MSYPNYSLLHEGRHGSVFPVHDNSLQLSAGLCVHVSTVNQLGMGSITDDFLLLLLFRVVKAGLCVHALIVLSMESGSVGVFP